MPAVGFGDFRLKRSISGVPSRCRDQAVLIGALQWTLVSHGVRSLPLKSPVSSPGREFHVCISIYVSITLNSASALVSGISTLVSFHWKRTSVFFLCWGSVKWSLWEAGCEINLNFTSVTGRNAVIISGQMTGTRPKQKFISYWQESARTNLGLWRFVAAELNLKRCNVTWTLKFELSELEMRYIVA